MSGAVHGTPRLRVDEDSAEDLPKYPEAEDYLLREIGTRGVLSLALLELTGALHAPHLQRHARWYELQRERIRYLVHPDTERRVRQLAAIITRSIPDGVTLSQEKTLMISNATTDFVFSLWWDIRTLMVPMVKREREKRLRVARIRLNEGERAALEDEVRQELEPVWEARNALDSYLRDAGLTRQSFWAGIIAHPSKDSRKLWAASHIISLDTVWQLYRKLIDAEEYPEHLTPDGVWKRFLREVASNPLGFSQSVSSAPEFKHALIRYWRIQWEIVIEISQRPSASSVQSLRQFMGPFQSIARSFVRSDRLADDPEDLVQSYLARLATDERKRNPKRYSTLRYQVHSGLKSDRSHIRQHQETKLRTLLPDGDDTLSTATTSFPWASDKKTPKRSEARAIVYPQIRSIVERSHPELLPALDITVEQARQGLTDEQSARRIGMCRRTLHARRIDLDHIWRDSLEHPR